VVRRRPADPQGSHLGDGRQRRLAPVLLPPTRLQRTPARQLGLEPCPRRSAPPEGLGRGVHVDAAGRARVCRSMDKNLGSGYRRVDPDRLVRSPTGTYTRRTVRTGRCSVLQGCRRPLHRRYRLWTQHHGHSGAPLPDASRMATTRCFARWIAACRDCSRASGSSRDSDDRVAARWSALDWNTRRFSQRLSDVSPFT
jgi:hypothetical protein